MQGSRQAHERRIAPQLAVDRFTTVVGLLEEARCGVGLLVYQSQISSGKLKLLRCEMTLCHNESQPIHRIQGNKLYNVTLYTQGHVRLCAPLFNVGGAWKNLDFIRALCIDYQAPR